MVRISIIGILQTSIDLLSILVSLVLEYRYRYQYRKDLGSIKDLNMPIIDTGIIGTRVLA